MIVFGEGGGSSGTSLDHDQARTEREQGSGRSIRVLQRGGGSQLVFVADDDIGEQHRLLNLPSKFVRVGPQRRAPVQVEQCGAGVPFENLQRGLPARAPSQTGA